MSDKLQVCVGFDSSEPEAFDVARASLIRNSSRSVAFQGLYQPELRKRGLYRRELAHRGTQIWDPISDAPMSTEFAITRFLTPHLFDRGWVLFCDCDFLWRGDVAELFALTDDRYALMCVQHDYRPKEEVKMDGQIQTRYLRKNWSSMMLLNCDHPSTAKLTLDLINDVPGRDLHRFCWLEDDEIGAVPNEWNWLEGISDPTIDPKAVHFTRGGPWHEGFEDVRFADEWNAELAALPPTAPAEETLTREA